MYGLALEGPTRVVVTLRRFAAATGSRLGSLLRQTPPWRAAGSDRPTRRHPVRCRWAFAGGALIASLVQAQPIEIGPGHLRVPVPGRPFGIVFSGDGQTLFVVLDAAQPRGDAALGVFTMADGVPSLVSRVPLGSRAAGIALSHDGHLLAVAQQDAGVGFYDVDALRANRENARLALLATGPGRSSGRDAGTIGVGFTNDDTLLLATDEWQARVSVFDVRRVR